MALKVKPELSVVRKNRINKGAVLSANLMAAKTLVLFAPWLAQVAALAQTCARPRASISMAAADGDASTSRRDLFVKAATVACGCCLPDAAVAMAPIKAAAPDQLKLYDLPRNQLQDAAFAQGMASGMGSYERAAYPAKQKLFEKLFLALQDNPEPTIVEIGIGSFPNYGYYSPRLRGRGGLDIIGVDPNDRMEGYARDNAKKAGLDKTSSLRVVHGVSEALPLKTRSCDAVVCSLTLCSVVDPAKSIAEIRRVLKPGGKFLFWEHVLSESDAGFAEQQVRATPMQVIRADGCHLDRRTGDLIKRAGFRSVDLEYLELTGFGFLNPTVAGLATA